MRFLLALLLMLLLAGAASAQDQLDFDAEIRGWYRNPDGSCVQCSIGMCGVWQNCPQAATLLWDTEYGSKVRGGSNPSRVERYADSRGIPIYNVTGSETFEWMKWASKTGRMSAIGCFPVHFQTLLYHDPEGDTWYVCNNNSTSKIDRYDWPTFRRHHLNSGPWVVILKTPPPPVAPKYVHWW